VSRRVVVVVVVRLGVGGCVPSHPRLMGRGFIGIVMVYGLRYIIGGVVRVLGGVLVGVVGGV